MAAFILTLTRVNSGMKSSTGSVPKNLDTRAEVDQYVAANPGVVSVVMDVVTEAQQQGLIAYAHGISRNASTGLVEDEITNLY